MRAFSPGVNLDVAIFCFFSSSTSRSTVFFPIFFLVFFITCLLYRQVSRFPAYVIGNKFKSRAKFRTRCKIAYFFFSCLMGEKREREKNEVYTDVEACDFSHESLCDFYRKYISIKLRQIQHWKRKRTAFFLQSSSLYQFLENVWFSFEEIKNV